jgi:two-component system chemotaxis response regulator CheB
LPGDDEVEHEPPSAFDFVLTVGSIGGPEAIRAIAAGLPAWFPVPVLVVQHRTAASQHLTVDLLQLVTPLSVVLARADDKPRPGCIYVLPADRQLTFDERGRFTSSRLTQYPADSLFGSAAQRGARAVTVVLSGANADGAAGLIGLKRAGGRIIAQSRESARCFHMPAAAIATGSVDLVLPANRIAHALLSFTAWPGASSLLHAPLAPWATLS